MVSGGAQETDEAGAGGGVSTGGVPGFVGTFHHSLDPKGRITIPSLWRAQLPKNTGLYVLPGLRERCLYVLPPGEMAERLANLRAKVLSDEKARKLMRALGSKSDIVTWDTQGRIRIKDELLAHANIGKQVVLNGSFRRFEIWNPDGWKQASHMKDEEFGEAAEYVGI